VALAPNHPHEALEWAKLAVRIAEQVPGDEAWRSRVLGWALAFLGNAMRAANDLPAAEQALGRGRKLWEAGAPGDPLLLNPAWLPGFEANLMRDQRRFAEALPKIDEALALDQGELRGQILLSKSALLHVLGDPEGSTAALYEAELLIDEAREPRLALVLQGNLLANLCDLDRFDEVEPRLAEVRALAERLGEKLDLQRVVWLHGKIETARGRLAEAHAALEQVRSEFRRLELHFDFALASLDLAIVLLMLGRTAEVRTIAEEVLAIFKAQRMHMEAVAAVRIFCEAAKRETATVELAKKLARFLRRSQLDPELRFEEDGGPNGMTASAPNRNLCAEAKD
jgi:tetratricopeptide (TPR) repeat protein